MKYYAAYNAGTRRRSEWQDHKNWKIVDMIINDDMTGFFNHSKATEDKEVAMMDAEDFRDGNRISKQYSKNPSGWAYKVWVHECNSKGDYLPTLGEVKKALEWAANKAMEDAHSAWMYAEILEKDVKVIHKELLQKIGD